MSYSGALTMGLQKIEIGTPVNGGVAQFWKTLGYTNEDSCELSTDDPESTDVNAEEADDPIYTIKKGGSMNLTFEVLNPDFEALVLLCGGKVENGKWIAPLAVPTVEMSIKLTPNIGYVYTFGRCSVAAKVDGKFAKSEPLKVTVNATILVPTVTQDDKFVASPLHSLALSAASLAWSSASADSTGKTNTLTTDASGIASAVADVDWATVTFASKVVTVKVSANAGADRSGNVCVVDSDGNTITFGISQVGA